MNEAPALCRLSLWLLVCWLGWGSMHLTIGGRCKAACKQQTVVKPLHWFCTNSGRTLLPDTRWFILHTSWSCCLSTISLWPPRLQTRPLGRNIAWQLLQCRRKAC